MPKTIRRLIAFLALAGCFLLGIATTDAGDVKSYRVRIGTIEIIGETYVFTSQQEREVFDVSIFALASEDTGLLSGTGIPGPKGLVEVAFRATTGELYEYREHAKPRVMGDFLKTRKKEEIAALVFVSNSGPRVEIQVKGKTPVCRVDLVFESGPVVLWSNIPESDANPPKNEQGKK